MMQPYNNQKGFSLISLLIATVIGIFIMGAAGKVYVDSKMTFNARSALSATMENGRFAIDDMRRTLVMAGRGIVAGEDERDSRRALAPIDTTSGYSNTGIHDAGTDASGSDIISVRYRIGPSCGGDIDISKSDPDSGRKVPDVSKLPATVRLWVDNTDKNGDGNPDDELVCEIFNIDGAGTKFGPQPLVSGIKQMRVLYGLDDNTADGYANRYLTASQVEDATVNPPPPGRTENWVRVVSLRIGLIASSDTAEIPASLQPDDAQELDLLGMDYTAPDKEHFFRTFSTTLSLRNLNATVQRQ